MARINGMDNAIDRIELHLQHCEALLPVPLKMASEPQVSRDVNDSMVQRAHLPTYNSGPLIADTGRAAYRWLAEGLMRGWSQICSFMSVAARNVGVGWDWSVGRHQNVRHCVNASRVQKRSMRKKSCRNFVSLSDEPKVRVH